MATVRDMLKAYDARRVTLDDLAADFRRRKWAPVKTTTDAQAWGVVDDDAPNPDSWEIVDAWPTLTPDAYAALSNAYAQATGH